MPVSSDIGYGKVSERIIAQIVDQFVQTGERNRRRRANVTVVHMFMRIYTGKRVLTFVYAC